MSTTPIDVALRLLQAGLSVIPIRPDGSKSPAMPTWKECQERPLAPEQARALWGNRNRGLAAVCGLVSGGLECLDFDVKALFGEWSIGLEEAAPGLLARLVIVDTPEGVHCWYRCAEIEGNQKLARDIAGKTVIETRGEGGYAILPGSPPECHPSGRTYEFNPAGLQDLADVQIVSESERALLLDLARAFNTFAELPKGAARPPEGKPGEVSPWDDFDARGPAWEDILTPHGWTLVRGTWDNGHLARPGQDRKGWAATVGIVRTKAGTPLFHPFSPNAGIPVGSYGKARAWIQLNHPGNYKAAAAALRQLGYGTPRDQANGKPAAAASKSWNIKPSVGLDGDFVSLKALMSMEFAAPKFAVEGLLCEGLNLLGGRPKMGKSWLSLLIAWAVAGGHSLDGRKVRQGPVLMLAMEDTKRRLQSRARMLGGALGWPFPETLVIRTSWPRADQGGLYNIREWLSDHPDAGLVVIDTLQKFRRPSKGNGNGNSYAEDYEAVGEMQELANFCDVPFLALTHTRKLKAEDPFDELSGTLGVSGAADGLLVLDRDRGADTGRLFVTGRDVAESTIPLSVDRNTWRWTLGAGADGIDSVGRLGSGSNSKIDQCVDWLQSYLAKYAFPAAELAAAAKAAGFSFEHVKQAKTRLKERMNGVPISYNFGAFGKPDWWHGLGPRNDWTLRPAELARTAPEIPEIPETGGATAPSDDAWPADAPP